MNRRKNALKAVEFSKYIIKVQSIKTMLRTEARLRKSCVKLQ